MKRQNDNKSRKMLDYVLTIPAAILLAPFMAGIALWIRLDSPGPVFFKQTRVGIHKSHFEILKFRTMRTDAPKDMPTHLLKNPEQYITKSGAFLRKTSLDELPQIINILKGDMSIVGPRPALWNQYNLIEERDRYGANDVLPGLTGWAQIHGRDEISIKEKAKLDGYYVEHQGLWMDIRCILLTVVSVLKRDGVQEGGTGAMDIEEEGSDIEKLQWDYSERTRSRQPLVSVVIATHQREQELKHALASLVSQTWKNLEVILVDDNAEPQWNQKVENIVHGWKRKCPIPLKYIKNEKNYGSAASRNKGIRAASGEYITFLDDDDKYMPQKIENQIGHMLRADSDFSMTDLSLYDEEGKLEEKRGRNYLKSRTYLMTGSGQEEYVYDKKASKDLFASHLMYHMTGTDTLMFRREYLEAVGGFPPIDVGDEFYLMKEAITCGGRFSYLPVCEVKAIVHRKTEGLSSSGSKVEGENKLYEYKKQFFPELSKKQVKEIKMRHHLVLAYAYLRIGSYGQYIMQACQAMAAEPIACIRMVLARII